MATDFWLQKWVDNKIGFHQDQYNPFLVEYWKKYCPEVGAVFVPLCGKTKDMLFLREIGHQVYGVELSEIAVKDFFQDNNLSYKVEKRDDFIIYSGGGFCLFCGDLFKLKSSDFKNVDYIYDRASLIALSKSQQGKYCAFIKQTFPQSSLFLITLEFDNPKIGPPFSTSQACVENYFADHFEVEKITELSIKSEEIRVHDGNVTKMKENVFFIKQKGQS